MARKESEFDSNSNQNRSSSSKRKWNHQDETRSNPSTSKNQLPASIQHFVKKPSDPNKWTSIQSNTSSRDRDRVAYSKDGRSATKIRGASAIPQTTTRRYDDANSRIGYPPSTSYQHFSSPGPGYMNSSRSYHAGGEDAYRQPDPRFKPPPPPMAQMMAPPFSRAPSLNRPESAIATPPPSNLGSSPFQTRGQPPIMGPPTFLGDRGRSTSSSHYPSTSILPSWNPHINPQVYPRPPASVSSSSSSSYHHRQTSATPFSSRFHPAHPLARSTSIQPGGGIGNPYGPPSLGGGLPFAASMGAGAFGRSFSVRSGSIAPSNRSRNTTTSTVRNRKSLPKSDWDNLMGMMQDSKNEEKERGLEKEREKPRAREEELRLERLEKEKEKSQALDSNRRDQVLEAVEDAAIEAQAKSSKNQIQLEESVEEEEQASEESSNLPSKVTEQLQDEIVQEASSIKPKSSSKKSSLLEDRPLSSTIDPIFLKDDSQLQASTSRFDKSIASNSTPPKVIKCPSLSSWYLCHAPVRSVPVEVLKSHPHASTLKSWVHLQGFRIGGDQNGNVWKSSAIISRLALEGEDGSQLNVVYSSEASEQLKLNELQRIKQEEEEEIKEKELKTLVSRFSTASGKVYEVRGRSIEKEMNQRGFKNCLKVLQDHSIDLDHESLDEVQVNQVWPENEVWIEAVIQDLIEIERKITEKKTEKKKKRESMKSKEVVEVEEGDEQVVEKAETSGILNNNSSTSPLGLKRKRKSSSKVQENLEIENAKTNESRTSRKSSSQSQEGIAVVDSIARKARRSSPLKTRSKSENTTAEDDGDGKSRKKKKRNSEVEHDFELIIPVYRRRSESSLSRKKSRSVVDDEESRADEVGRQAEEIESREENQEEKNEPLQSPRAELESEDLNQGQEEVPENQESLEQIEEVAQERSNSDELQPQPEEMELDMDMPPLDDQPEIEDEDMETDAKEAAAETLMDLDFHEQEEEEPELEEAPIQTTIEESSDEEVAGALFEDQDQEDENLNPTPSRSVDADEFEASPSSFASSSRRASTSRSTSKAIKPRPKPKQSRNSTGDLLNSSTSKPFKPKKPRASAPSTSISKSSSEPFSVVGQTKINRELAALTKSRFGTFNFLKPVNLVVKAVENEEEPEDEEMEEIRRMEREIMNSSQERPSSNVKSNRKSSKGTSNSNGKDKKKSRKSLPVTTKELQQIRSSSSSSSSSSSRSDSVEPSLDVVPSTSFRSSTRTRVTSRPREWWKVNEDTFKSPLARSHELSSLKRSPKKVRNVKRNRKVMESDESDEEIEANGGSSEENQTPKKKVFKRTKPSRIATDSPSNSETEPKSNKNPASTSKEKKAKKQIGSASLTYSRKGSRSPVKKAGSSSFPIEELGSEDAYVFSD